MPGVKKSKPLPLKKRNQQKRFSVEIAAAKSAQFRTEALILQAKKGSQEELDLKLKSLDQGYLAEVLVKGRTIGELELMDAKYFNDRQELLKQFNQKEAEDAVNTRIAQLNSLLAVTEDPASKLKARKDLIDAQADLEAQGVRNSEINEELRRSKIKAIYDRALADKKQLEKDKNQAEIEALLSSQLSKIEREKSKLKRANVKDPDSDKAFEDELAQEQRLIDAKRLANFNLLAVKSIDNAEFRRRENELENAEDQLAIQREQRKQDKIRSIKEFAINSFIQLTEVLNNISDRGYKREQDQVRELFDQKRISQTEYDNRVKELRRQQAIDDKKQAIFNTLLQQGPVVLAGFQKGGFAGVAAAFALFFTLLNAVTSTEVPQYRFGGEIDGPGTGTSDSVPIRASKGEFITRYEQTQKHKEALKAINEDRYDAYLMNNELPRLYQNMNVSQVPQYLSTTSGAAEFDYDKMAEAFAAKLADNPQAVLSFDEDGIRLSIKKGNQVTEYKNKKLTT
jgi:hypothetical protein